MLQHRSLQPGPLARRTCAAHKHLVSPPSSACRQGCMLKHPPRVLVVSCCQPAPDAPAPTQTQTRKGASSATAEELAWDYKYPRLPTLSPVQEDEAMCQKIEALVQHVFEYPRLPNKAYLLFQSMGDDVDLNTITNTAERMSDTFGRELSFHLFYKEPFCLTIPFDTVSNRVEQVRLLLNLRYMDVFMLLRKNPRLLCFDFQIMHTRFQQLHKITNFNHDEVLRLVIKWPVILNLESAYVADVVDSLRNITYTRESWQMQFENITPSLLAFFIKDQSDLTARLEYLVLSGEGTSCTLRDVFKVSNQLFCKRHRSFRQWSKMRKLKKQRLMEREQQGR